MANHKNNGNRKTPWMQRSPIIGDCADQVTDHRMKVASSVEVIRIVRTNAYCLVVI